MEEGRPPSTSTAAKDNHHLPLPLPPALETYVVQIPRDQIHRFPPAEHAKIIERYLNENNKKSGSTTSRKTLLWSTAGPAVLAFLLLVVLLSIRATAYNPAPPEFVVARIQAKGLVPGPKARRGPEFDLRLTARSPNKRLSVSYEAGPDDDASLVYKNRIIGQGKIRSRIESGAGGGSVDFPLVLKGNEDELSPEVKKRLSGGAGEKAMELTMEVAVEFRSWLRNARQTVMVTCDFKVKNSLVSNGKVSSQKCTTVIN